MKVIISTVVLAALSLLTHSLAEAKAADYATIAALPCANVLNAHGTTRFPALIESVTEFINRKNRDGRFGSNSNIEDYVLTECRLNEPLKIGQAVEKLLGDQRHGQLPRIPIGGASQNPQSQGVGHFR